MLVGTSRSSERGVYTSHTRRCRLSSVNQIGYRALFYSTSDAANLHRGCFQQLQHSPTYSCISITLHSIDNFLRKILVLNNIVLKDKHNDVNKPTRYCIKTKTILLVHIYRRRDVLRDLSLEPTPTDMQV